jgi:cytochrome d ubiquinol oxidase subunit I
MPFIGGQKWQSGSKLAVIMTQSTVPLSELQFFIGLGFLCLFLILELGLAWMLVYFRGRSLGARGAVWIAAYRFWVRIFALAFVIRSAALVSVLIQFGTLWPGLMDRMGDVASPLLAVTVLTAFIFQSCFVGAMLFGQRYVSDRVHALIVLMVALGVTLLALCLVALHAWMNTPQGAELVNGQYVVRRWPAVVFSAAMPWFAGLFFSVSGAAAAYLMMGVVASQALRRPLDQSEAAVFHVAVGVALVSLSVAIVMMAGVGKVTAQHQPAKAAAAAGYWNSGSPPRIVLLARPDERAGANRAELLSWRGVGAKWLGRDEQGALRGLDQFSGMSPPVAATFWGLRIALYVGLLMLMVAVLFAVKLAGKGMPGFSRPWLALSRLFMFSGWLSFGAGFVYMAAGTLPYAIQGTITYGDIAGSTPGRILAVGLALHVLVYLALIAGFFQLLRHTIRFGVVPVARRRGRA